MTPEKSNSIQFSSEEKNAAELDQNVIKGFENCNIPPEMLLEHLNPELNQEMEEQETNECMPLVADELRSIGMAKLLELRESQKRDEKVCQLGQQYSDINKNGEDELDEYIADLAESAEQANPELG